MPCLCARHRSDRRDPRRSLRRDDPSDRATADLASTRSARRPPPLPQLVAELWDLVVAYFKQETVVPLKQLGRYIGLRARSARSSSASASSSSRRRRPRLLQAETGTTFTGNWSWVPYLIVTAALMLGAALTWMARGDSGKRPEVAPMTTNGQ